jgi:tetratricopeptide (TPR) repeat protein
MGGLTRIFSQCSELMLTGLFILLSPSLQSHPYRGPVKYKKTLSCRKSPFLFGYYFCPALLLIRTVRRSISEAGDKNTECACLSNLANAYHIEGNAGKAKEHCERQLNLAISIGDKLQQANALCGIAILYSVCEERQQAAEYFKQAADLHDEVGDLTNKGNDLKNLARELGLLGHQRDAVRAPEEAAKAFGGIDSPQAAEVRALLSLLR